MVSDDNLSHAFAGGSNGDVDRTFEDEVLLRMSVMREGKMSRDEKHGQVDQLLEQSQTPPEPPRRTSHRNSAGSLAEERAAKKLGISTTRLRQLADDLWGRALEEESSRRVRPGSTPQARGRVTRILVDELRAALEGH